MNEVVYNVTAFVAVVLLLFSTASPVNARTSETQISSQQNPVEVQVAEPEALPREIKAQTTTSILVWYETSLQFGADGNPQTQINILGNVEGNVASLRYRLNTGSYQDLAIGPNSTRLANRGDFNVAIDLDRLNDGDNTVTITAYNSSGVAVASNSVTFPYTANRTWRLPYSTNWSAGTIHSQAQVVDGLWTQTGGGVKTVQVGYDRVIAIGDMSWTNYEVLVPITLHAFYPDPSDPNDAGGVGIIARWIGHTGTESLPSGWSRIGAYAYYSNRLGRLALRLSDALVLQRNFTFRAGRTYMFKLRVETSNDNPTTDGRYSFKIWENGSPEPAWNNTSFFYNVIDQDDALLNGSVLLVAHRADATFGNVTVCPLDQTYPLTVNVDGSGSVSKSPNKTNYACGEGVTVSADPADGWYFDGWSGTLSSSDPSFSFNMTGSRTLTATFRQGAPVEQPYDQFIPYINRK